MTPGEPLVEASGLTRRFGDVAAVSDVSFTVRRGEMFGLIGPDGAGKTTTLRMVLGLLKADGGSVRTCGLDPFRERRRLSGKVGYLSQKFSLYGDLSVDENVAFFAEVHDVREYAPKRDALLEMVRMTPFRERLAARLSGGMKQKLALVSTLVHTPELLVLDEPTTGVDPVSRRDFWRLLARLQRDGLTILLTTPYLDEAERCTRVALVDHGRLLALDTPGRLRASLKGTMVEMIVADPRAAHEQLSREGVSAQVFGDRLHVWFAGVEPSAVEERSRDVARRIGATAVRPITPSLEDVYIDRLGAASRPVAETA